MFQINGHLCDHCVAILVWNDKLIDFDGNCIEILGIESKTSKMNKLIAFIFF